MIRVLVVVAFALVPLTSTAAESEKPTALQIFDAALEKFESDRVALRKWQYHQTLTTHQFDSAGKVTARGTWTSIVRPGDPRPLEYLSKSMTGKLSFFKAGAEETADGSAPASGSKEKPSRASEEMNQAEFAVEAVRKFRLRDRYQWRRLRDARVAGENAFVLSFEPKPNQNTRTREERFFALLAGRLWVSQQDFTVLKAEAALQAPSQLFWILARVTTFRCTYEVEPIRGNRLFQESRATARTVVTFPFFAVRQRHWLTIDHYEARTPRGSPVD